ncbi:MAG TPA: ABC transporter ATP-binding protein [Gemmatimonadaceae bacterium]
MSASNGVLWTLDRVSYRHPSADVNAVDDVSVSIGAGRMTALLGPNGAGKSTLFQLLLGTLTPLHGAVTFERKPLGDWTRRDLALEIGAVPQGEAEPLFSVREIVAMGRYPRLGPWRREQPEDIAAISAAMERCDVAHLAHRWLSTLSGGERQRVRLARALAQEPSVLALDEPTTFLDIRHEMTTFELLHRLRSEGVGIVLVTHNLNLAARYADELILMNRGRVVTHGSPSDVLTKERVDDVYEWPVAIARDLGGAPQVVPLSRSSR